MQQRKALGRGLDALIPSSPTVAEEASILMPKPVNTNIPDRMRTAPIDSIVPNRLQPRKVFDEEKIKELFFKLLV